MKLEVLTCEQRCLFAKNAITYKQHKVKKIVEWWYMHCSHLFQEAASCQFACTAKQQTLGRNSLSYQRPSQILARLHHKETATPNTFFVQFTASGHLMWSTMFRFVAMLVLSFEVMWLSSRIRYLQRKECHSFGVLRWDARPLLTLHDNQSRRSKVRRDNRVTILVRWDAVVCICTSWQQIPPK